MLVFFHVRFYKSDQPIYKSHTNKPTCVISRGLFNGITKTEKKTETNKTNDDGLNSVTYGHTVALA
jgi:hypothetical protein